MPQSKEVDAVFTELRTVHEEFKKAVDQQVEEVRKSGYSRAETDEKITKLEADLTELRKQHDELITRSNRPTGIGQTEQNDPEMELRKSAFIKFIRKGLGESGRAIMSADEVRALSSASDADGGFLVPTAWESELIMNAYNEADIRPVAQVGSTGRDTVYMPALKKPTVAWGIANLAVDAQELNAGAERIEIHDLRALVLIHNNTLDDSDANVWAELSGAFSMAIAEAEDDAFVTGAGHQMPRGILADSRVLANVVNTGVAAAITDASNNGIDALIGMLHGLKKVYRRNATWAMNSTTEGVYRKIKDDNGQYLWQPPVQAGAPATLLGRPVINPEGTPDVAADAFPVILGDFRKGFKIRDRQGITISRLVERYAEYDQTGFIVKRRLGAQVTLPEAFKVLKVST